MTLNDVSFFHLAKKPFGTSADVLVEICHVTDALLTSFPCLSSTIHFTCLLYTYNFYPLNHTIFAMLTHGKNKADLSSGHATTAVGPRRASRKKTLTEKGQAYSASSAVFTTTAISAVTESVPIGSASAKEGTGRSAHANASRKNTFTKEGQSKEGTSSRSAVARSGATASNEDEKSEEDEDDYGSLDKETMLEGDIDNADPKTASFNVSLKAFPILSYLYICNLYQIRIVSFVFSFR